MARDESRDVDRRRAATGLAGALARPAQLLGVGVPSAVAWRMALRGAGANHGAGQGARDEHARQRSGARPRAVQTDTLLAPEACDSSGPPGRALVLQSGMTLLFLSGMT